MSRSDLSQTGCRQQADSTQDLSVCSLSLREQTGQVAEPGWGQAEAPNRPTRYLKAELDERFVASVAEYRRRAERARQERLEAAGRRRAGLRARHAAKLRHGDPWEAA